MTTRRRLALSLVLAAALSTAVATPVLAQTSSTAEVLAYGGDQGVTVQAPAGSTPARVHPTGSQPAVSPDGTQLAYVFRDDSERISDSIHLSDLDGSHDRALTGGGENLPDSAPTWSPDGNRLAFVRELPDGPHLATVRADGSGEQVLPLRGRSPVWSPDGRFLAFASGSATDVVDAAGAGQVRLTGSAPLSWSTDGTRLLVTDRRSGLAQLSLGDRTAAPLPVPGATLLDGEYSASGRQVYAVRGSAGHGTAPEIVRVGTDGSVDATFGPVPGSGPSAGGGDRARPAVTAPEPVTRLSVITAASRVTLRFDRRTASDTAGVTVRYAAGTTAPATVTDGLPGPDSLASTADVPRLAPSTTYAFSVFTRDWSGAASVPATVVATTPAEVATTLTLDAPDQIVYGDGSALTGRLVREDTGTGVPGAAVTLLGHHEGESDSRLQALSTDADGRFTFRRLTSEATRYRVEYAGDGTLLPAATGALVLVQQRVTLTFTPSDSVPQGSRASVTATVAPAFPGGNVRFVQRLDPSGERNRLQRLDSRSRSTFTLDTAHRNAPYYLDPDLSVQPGYRRGYLNRPVEAVFTIS